MTNEYKLLTEFYPTPPELAAKMLEGIDFEEFDSVLEPSAGKGDLIGYYLRAKRDIHFSCRYSKEERYKRTLRCAIDTGVLESYEDVYCVEMDRNLCSILRDRGSNYHVINEDFLDFEDERHYDMVLMNPPFSNGEEHLLKAISLAEKTGSMIVCLLNAETIRNPFSNKRKELIKKLKQYKATCQFVKDTFKKAEHQTDVEVAIIHCNVPSPFKSKSRIWEELEQKELELEIPENPSEMIQADDELKAAVMLYKREIAAGKKLIEEYLALKPYLTNRVDPKEVFEAEAMLKLSNKGDSNLDWNKYVYAVRYKYWHQLLHKPAFLGNLTSNLRDEYFQNIKQFAERDFSLKNIYSVKMDILQRMAQGIEDKIVSLFEELSYKNSMDCSGNVHYFSGWKSNSAFKINSKVVIPYVYCWKDYSEKFSFYELGKNLSDLEIVLNFLLLDKESEHDYSCRNLDYWLNHYEQIQQTKKMQFRHFDVDIFKKGTVHIRFRDPELLKRFNLYGCMHKGWLPPSYGKKAYEVMNEEEQEVIDSFEGKEEYEKVYLNPDKYILAPEKLLLTEGG